MIDKNKMDELISRVSKNKRVLEIINKYKFSREKIIEGLPIFIDMAEEDEIGDPKNKYITSIDLKPNGYISRVAVLSESAKKEKYIDNIWTKEIQFFDFQENEKLTISPSRKNIINWMSRFLDSPNSYAKGFYLHGTTNVGKTFLLKRLAKKMATLDFTVSLLSCSTLYSKVRETFSDQTKSEYVNLKQKLINSDFLFLDDIGSEPISGWFRDEFLFTILEQRLEKKKPVFFTSRFSIKQLEAIESGKPKSIDLEKSRRLINKVQGLADPIILYPYK